MNALLSTLAILPSHWPLTVTNANKQPLGKEWQKNPFTPSQLLNALTQQGKVPVRSLEGVPYAVRPQGIGLLCGQNSQEFLVAVDCDGASAHQKLKELARGAKIPATVAFSSGRPGRAQYLFRLPGTYIRQVS
jgi:hypothetical protein